MLALQRVMNWGTQTGHPDAHGASILRGFSQIMAGIVQAVIVNGEYLIVYEVGPTFFRQDLTLFEVLIASLHNKAGGIRAVPRALELLADRHGCTAIACGNSIQRPGLSRVYEHAGFTRFSTQFYKEKHQWVV